MATVKIRYFIEKPGRNGPRYFWQPSQVLHAAGFRLVRLPNERAVAIAEATRLNDQLDAWRAGGDAKRPSKAIALGTVDALIALYKRSPGYKDCKPKTKLVYDYCLATVAAWCGDRPVRALTPKLVQAFYRSLLKTPAKAHAAVRVLRLLLEFGRLEGWLELNPAARPRLQDHSRKGRLWSREAVAAFVAAADRLGWHSVGTAVMLNEWIGQREGDVIALSRAAWREGALWITQRKTGAEVALPVGLVPGLVARLEAELARNASLKVRPTTILVCESTGRPWKEYHFRHVVAQVRAAAMKNCPELADLWFMHLRHTAITRLAEANCENGLIACVTGHSQATVQQMIDRYMIRTSAMARAAFTQRLEKERG